MRAQVQEKVKDVLPVGFRNALSGAKDIFRSDMEKRGQLARGVKGQTITRQIQGRR